MEPPSPSDCPHFHLQVSRVSGGRAHKVTSVHSQMRNAGTQPLIITAARARSRAAPAGRTKVIFALGSGRLTEARGNGEDRTRGWRQQHV